MKEFFTKIYYWFKRNKYFHLDIKQGIINLFQYFIIIWKDRDWDHAFTEYLLIFKLKRQAKYIAKNKRYGGWDRDVQRINTVVSLLEKDLDEFYGMEYMKYYKTDWYTEPIENCENLYEFKSKLISDNSPEYFLKHVSAWKKVRKKPKADSPILVCIMLAKERQQKCHDLAWELIKRNIQRWWD